MESLTHPESLDKSVRDLITKILDSVGLQIYDLLKGKENVSEFKIAEDMDMSINQVRSVLYKLSSYNLVYSIRKKDRQKGWYIYYWTFNMRYAKDFLIMKGEERIKSLKKTLKLEKGEQFYKCPNNCIRFDLSEAMEYDFKCTECEKILEFDDNQEKIKNIQDEVALLEEEVNVIKSSIVPELPSERTARRKAAGKKKIVKGKLKKGEKEKVIKKKAKKKIVKKKKVEKRKVKKPIKRWVKKKQFKREAVVKKKLVWKRNALAIKEYGNYTRRFPQRKRVIKRFVKKKKIVKQKEKEPVKKKAREKKIPPRMRLKKKTETKTEKKIKKKAKKPFIKPSFKKVISGEKKRVKSKSKKEPSRKKPLMKQLRKKPVKNKSAKNKPIKKKVVKHKSIPTEPPGKTVHSITPEKPKKGKIFERLKRIRF
ncbi:MAG: hypothetical protein KKG60_02575 [Nanoarchaeota archaeon]|nr:hypothetical protein [Nanoarchaeota archaeon]